LAAQFEDVSQEKLALERRIAATENKLDEALHTIKLFNDETKSLRIETTELKKVKKQQQTTIRQLNTDLKNKDLYLEKVRGAYGAELDHARKRKKELEDDKITLAAQFEDAKVEVAGLKSRILLLEEHLYNSTKTLNTATEKLEEAEKAAYESERGREALETRMSEDEEKMEIMETQLTEAIVIAEDADRKYEEGERKLRKSEERARTAEEKAKTAEQRAKTAEERAVTTEAFRKELNGYIENLKSSVDQAEDRARKAENDAEDARNVLTEQMDNCRKACVCDKSDEGKGDANLISSSSSL